MYSIEGTTITLTRGDTMIAEVTPYQGDEPYVPQEGDTLRFVMKSNKMNTKRTEYVDPEPLVIKAIPTDTMLLRLDPEDTKPFGFGNYVYDIELTFADGKVDTFINNAELLLVPEVG